MTSKATFLATTSCHPEQREGSRCLLAWKAGVTQARTQIPRFARDNSSYQQQTSSYRFAATGTLTGSGGALGMVVTRPVGGGGAAWAVGAGCAGAVANPSVLRTSASSLAMTSLLSFRNWRAFSRPWPM